MHLFKLARYFCLLPEIYPSFIIITTVVGSSFFRFFYSRLTIDRCSYASLNIKRKENNGYFVHDLH